MSENIKINIQSVREFAKILNETGLSEIEYKTEQGSIRVKRTLNVEHVVPASTSQQIGQKTEQPVVDFVKENLDPTLHPGLIKSPMVGTAYLSSEPNKPPFVNVGDNVTKGQTLLIVEAMKVMNPIKAPKSGVVIKVCVEDASPIEFNEPLIIVE